LDVHTHTHTYQQLHKMVCSSIKALTCLLIARGMCCTPASFLHSAPWSANSLSVSAS